MHNKVLLAFLIADGLFAASGGLLIAVVLITKNIMHHPRNPGNVASNLLLMNTPLDGVLFNAGLIFFTFAISVPGLILPNNRIWFNIHGWLVIACGITTLVLGLDIWFSTLQTRSNVGVLWSHQSAQDRSLLQQKFKCCGYLNSPFEKDSTCPDAAAAAQLQNCVGPFSDYANTFLDLVFTSQFGLVALDTILFLSTVMVLKSRAEKERYRHIDEKNAFNGI